MLSHPQPQPQSELLLKKLPLLPHPPQKKSKMIIQIKELLHPHPLLEEGDVPHPHPVAVKSLIVLPPKGFYLWFIICTTACMCFHILKKNLLNILVKSLNKFQYIVK